ncbi:MAG: hypothetical protein M3151_01920 [Actinomycetota bacterium]|nr:hypothetical protein [Actinomycetota bacterium]
MRKRTGWILTALLAVLVVGTGVALANGLDSEGGGAAGSATEVHGSMHHRHGGSEGRLPAQKENVELVGKMNVNQDFPGRVSDVGVFGNHAYLGAFNERNCQKGGVYVFNIANPAAPKQVNFIRAANNSYVGEGVQVIKVTTPQYTGDLLVQNNEICGAANTGAKGGISLIDVTNPKVHKYLAQGVGDFNPAGFYGGSVAHTVHSVFAWDAGEKAYAVLVDNEESEDVDIMDISNPRAPKLVAEYDLKKRFPQIFQEGAGLEEVWHHDIVVKRIEKRIEDRIEDRWIMLVSYWDGGYVQLDVTHPTKVEYVADSDFAFPDREAAENGLDVHPEGNGHQAEFSADNQYIVAADEDFLPYKIVAANLTDATKSTVSDLLSPYSPYSVGDTFAPGESIEGESVYVGLACPNSPDVPAGSGEDQIAVVERGGCRLQEKLDTVATTGGYEGMILFNWETGVDGWFGCDQLYYPNLEGSLPSAFMTRRDGYELFDVPYDHAQCLAGTAHKDPLNTNTAPIEVGITGDRVKVGSEFDGWGYVHLYQNGDGKLQELDTYAIPEAHNPHYATGHGDLTVHEVAMSERDNRLAYFSYYSGGFRVARIVNDRLVEVGSFIDQGGSRFWGVQTWQKDGKEYVLGSDRDYGVYIFRYTGQ